MTPIGYAFGVGLILGFVVGFVICSQILSGDVADHLTEYATLRAIGYPAAYLSRLVIGEALTLCWPGTARDRDHGQWVLRHGKDHRVAHEFDSEPEPDALFFATVVMCIGSGLLALRKAKTVDPANVF